jgi:glutamine amidotransferase PdxT
MNTESREINVVSVVILPGSHSTAIAHANPPVQSAPQSKSNESKVRIITGTCASAAQAPHRTNPRLPDPTLNGGAEVDGLAPPASDIVDSI